MDLPKRASLRVVCALALAALALPLASPSGGPARVWAQSVPSSLPVGCTPSTSSTISSGCYLAVRPPLALNLIGQPQTFTFTCDTLTAGLFGAGGTAEAPTIPPGCYDVRGTVTDLATGSPATIQFGTCANVVAVVQGGSFDCSDVASPICPVGTIPAPVPGPTTPCAAYSPAIGSVAENTATMAINPGAPHSYVATFTGYIPTTSLGSCPAGTTLVQSTMLTETFGLPPASFPLGPVSACYFSVSADEKYVEITNVALRTQPVGTSCGGHVLYLAGSVFGHVCNAVARTSGATVVKFQAAECPPGATTPIGLGSPPNPPFPPGSYYSCNNDTLLVANIAMNGPDLTFSAFGPGSFSRLHSRLADFLARIGLCAGVPGGTTATALPGAVLSICPTGIGTVSVQACLAPPLPFSQPPVCSNTIEFSFRR